MVNKGEVDNMDENKDKADDMNDEKNTDSVNTQSEVSHNDPWTDNEISEQTSAHKPEGAVKSSSTTEEELRWQKDLVNRLAFASLNEQRRGRRWGIFFKSLMFVYLFSLLFMFNSGDGGDIAVGPHTAVVELKGIISDDSPASADNVVSALRDAFESRNSKGVIIRINSPGGSPVQAGYIYDEIVRLRAQYPDKHLYAVVTDMAASAAYYIASAADEIYADKASMVGSIGVIAGSYGYVEGMKKLGIERRVMTAGENKAFLDPFSPLKESHKRHMQTLLDDVHEQFITAVKKGRGERIKDDPKIYSGLIWTGEQSVGLGLVDGLANTSGVARDIIGQDKIVDYTIHPNYLDRFAEKIGVTMTRTLFSAANEIHLQ